jgi:RND family efflux transporter MFP subunit
MRVHTMRAAVKPMDHVVVVTGSFHSREQSTLSVKVPGRLEKMSVDVGSVVKKGDELAQIERADYELRLKQAQAVLGQARAVVGLPPEGDDDRVDVEKTGAIRQAKAVLEEATANRNRVQQLHADKIAPQSELDTAEAAYAVALSKYQDALEDIRGRVALVVQRRAELNLARKQLEDTITTAPFDGIIHQRLANLGEYVQAGTPLIIIAGVDPLRLRLEVPEREATQIRAGQSVRVTVSGNTNVYTTKIARVSPILVEANRMLLVEADVPATPPLRPGLFAQAEILVSENDPTLCVPVDAVASFVGIEKVFVVKDGKAVEKGIMTGRRRGGLVEIVSGIAPGDVVIMNPSRLRSGQPVIEELNAAAR